MAPKPDPKSVASNDPPKTTPRSEAGLVNAPTDTKPESSGVQHAVEVMVLFVPSEAEAHIDFCSEDLENHHRTLSTFTFRSPYLHGCVVAAGGILVELVRPATRSYGSLRFGYLLYHPLPVLMDYDSRHTLSTAYW